MERRTRRSPSIIEALNHFLDALCLKRNLDAVALTTGDGLLVAARGQNVDLEALGAIGASTHKTSAAFDGHTMFTNRFEVNNVQLCLTSLSAPVRDDAAVGSLMRILAV
jgi:hypothetical protein